MKYCNNKLMNNCKILSKTNLTRLLISLLKGSGTQIQIKRSYIFADEAVT